jgi:hypothetical protein
VTLWHLLIGLCFAMPLAGGLAAASHVHAGPAGMLIAALVGLATGAACSWLLRTFGGLVLARTRPGLDGPQPASSSEWIARGVYVLGVLWIAFSLFLGAQISSGLLARLS